MEARTAVDPTALEDRPAVDARVIRLPVSRVADARAAVAESSVDVDREAYELAQRIGGGDGVVVALPLPQVAVELPRVAWGEIGRRIFDVVVSTIALVLLAPLMIAIAIAIRLDSPGPVLFRQRRLGKDCEPFTINKFRTMCDRADAAVHEEYMRRQITYGGHAAVADGKQIYKPWPDHRVTRVGELLRRWSLDELPQLINVLRGEMSLIGFRPPIDYEVECYPDWYFARFAEKPGITGLWQVSGRNERSYEEMVLLDIEYAERRSWRLDLAVLLRTLGVVLRRRGAY